MLLLMFSITQSQLFFESGGKDIRLDCFLPSASGQRFPAVIGLHGSGGGHASMADPAGLLAERGIAVYVLHYFDRTGTTEIDGLQTIFRHFPVWMKTLWDAVSFVARQPQVDPERIGLLGFSLGAYLALSASAIDSRVQAVVEFFGGMPKEMKLFSRRQCPVLILHGDQDKTVPVEEAYHLQRILEKKQIPYEIQIYPGVGHGFSGEVWRDAGLRTLAFLSKHLAAGSRKRETHSAQQLEH
ncbi:MAG TPA: dienelactone hydrolase family protein [Terriglobales bacterium]|nr:dienelactone hydrolase family protein [Terriglobales bacterium]